MGAIASWKQYKNLKSEIKANQSVLDTTRQKIEVLHPGIPSNYEGPSRSELQQTKNKAFDKIEVLSQKLNQNPYKKMSDVRTSVNKSLSTTPGKIYLGTTSIATVATLGNEIAKANNSKVNENDLVRPIIKSRIKVPPISPSDEIIKPPNHFSDNAGKYGAALGGVAAAGLGALALRRYIKKKKNK